MMNLKLLLKDKKLRIYAKLVIAPIVLFAIISGAMGLLAALIITAAVFVLYGLTKVN